MSKTKRNRWSNPDLTQREQRKLRKKDLNKVKSRKVRERLEGQRADRLQRGDTK